MDVYMDSAAPKKLQKKSILPEWDLDGDITVDGDGQQAENGTLREHEDKTGNEQAAVEVTAKACANNDGKGDGEKAHSHIGGCQGHYKVVGDTLQVAVQANSPAHQHIPSHSQCSNQQLQANVEGNCAAIHADCFTAGVVWD